MQQEIFKNRLELQPSLDEMLETIKSSSNKAILWTKAALDTAFKGTCEYKIVPEFNLNSWYAILLVKNSQFRQLFDYK